MDVRYHVLPAYDVTVHHLVQLLSRITAQNTQVHVSDAIIAISYLDGSWYTGPIDNTIPMGDVKLITVAIDHHTMITFCPSRTKCSSTNHAVRDTVIEYMTNILPLRKYSHIRAILSTLTIYGKILIALGMVILYTSSHLVAQPYLTMAYFLGALVIFVGCSKSLMIPSNFTLR